MFFTIISQPVKLFNNFFDFVVPHFTEVSSTHIPIIGSHVVISILHILISTSQMQHNNGLHFLALLLQDLSI